MQGLLNEYAYTHMLPEAENLKKDAKYHKAVALVTRIEQKLLERLDGEDKDWFEKYVAAKEEADELTAVNNLVYGYRLGLMMTAEAFLGMDGLYSNGEEL